MSETISRAVIYVRGQWREAAIDSRGNLTARIPEVADPVVPAGCGRGCPCPDCAGGNCFACIGACHREMAHDAGDEQLHLHDAAVAAEGDNTPPAYLTDPRIANIPPLPEYQQVTPPLPPLPPMPAEVVRWLAQAYPSSMDIDKPADERVADGYWVGYNDGYRAGHQEGKDEGWGNGWRAALRWISGIAQERGGKPEPGLADAV